MQNDTQNTIVGEPLTARRAEILKAIENRTYEYAQLPELVTELGEIEAALQKEPAEEPRRCYFISELDRDENGEFIPCIAVEGEPGYYKTDWHWGKDRELAEQCADEMNQGLGISKQEAMKIQFSTMRIGSGKKNTKTTWSANEILEREG